MKCFAHPDREAVGVCKACLKGTCRDCAVDLGGGLACLGRCEDRVRALIRLMDAQIRISPIAAQGSNLFATAGMLFAIGAIFLGWGLWCGPGYGFVVALGAVFLAMGIFSVASASRIRDAFRGPGASK